MFTLLEFVVAVIDGFIHSPKMTLAILLVFIVATVGIVVYKSNEVRKPNPKPKTTIESVIDKIKGN